MKRVHVLPMFCMALGCGDAPAPEPPPAAEGTPLDEARARLPDLLTLQTEVIARSCSPNPGVCHQSNNYPDLRTAGSLLAMIGMPCNLEIPDPTQGWDACEPKADRVVVDGFATDIAWTEKLGSGTWKIGLRTAPDRSRRGAPAITDHAGEPMLHPEPELGVELALVAGEKEATLFVTPTEEGEDFSSEVDALMSTVAAGDPNRNGVFGFDDPNVERGKVITAGSLSRSYLWGRVTGTVPGTRMPLANQALSRAEYVALACWIEGVEPGDDARDPIDYASCEYASSTLSGAADSAGE